MKFERRRSDRITLTLNLELRGEDEKGHHFVQEARTINLNRHGVFLQVAPLRLGQTVRLINRLGHREGEFRVVGPVSPPMGGLGEWALESLNPDQPFWGIGFPPLPEGESEGAKGLLECQECRTNVLARISPMEAEVLASSGLLSRECPACGKMTAWSISETDLAQGARKDEAEMLEEATYGRKRRHRRAPLQLPALIRDYFGGVEMTQTENVSRGGLCFSSEVVYQVGQGLRVACPYDPSSRAIEIPARIVRNIEFKGRNRRLYGVRYENQEG